MNKLEVIIETPKFSFIKYKDDGSVDYVSPLPCPFNYGSVPNTKSGDGDRMDAVVLGNKLKGGTKKEFSVLGYVKFLDNDEEDPKFVCSENPMTSFEEFTVKSFFSFYGFAKGILNKLRGKKGVTKFQGVVLY